MLLLLDYERLVVTVHPENMPSSINKADVEQVDEVNIASNANRDTRHSVCLIEAECGWDFSAHLRSAAAR